MRHCVLDVNVTVLRQLIVREASVVLVTYSRLAEVDHRSFIAVLLERHSSQLCKGSTQGMASGLDSGLRVLLVQALNLGQNVAADVGCRLLEAVVHLTVTVGPRCVICFVEGQVSQPVLNRG